MSRLLVLLTSKLYDKLPCHVKHPCQFFSMIIYLTEDERELIKIGRGKNVMAVYIVSYDLRKPDFDYQPLYDALSEINAKRIQKSVWGVTSSYKARAIFDHLWKHMHNTHDRLFVVPFDSEEPYKAMNSVNKLNSF
jgi:hypothetical protein